MPKGVYQRRGKKGEEAKEEDSEKVPKLVLKVGKNQAPTEDSDNETLKKTPANQGGMEESDDEEGEEEKEEQSAKKKAPRKKRRFRLTVDRRSTKKREKKQPQPVPEKEEESEEEEKEESVPEVSMPKTTKEMLETFTPVQLLIDFLLRQLERKDPDEYFMFPVTEENAPNYSSVVDSPMDFYTMRNKLNSHTYTTLAEFKEDAYKIVSNAMAYNNANTVYHIAANKLEIVIQHYFSKDYLLGLRQHLPFMGEVTDEQLFPYRSLKPRKRPDKRPHRSIVDNMEPHEILASAKKAAAEAAAKLAKRRPNSHLAFWKQRDDGTTALNILTPEHSVARSAETNREFLLKDVVSKLKEGTPGLTMFTEKPENMVVPTAYLDYGPYASFAPQYDSTWATLNKPHSDLLLSTYGDKDGAQYAWSLRSMAKGTSEDIVEQVDNLLDALTNGEHTKAYAKLKGVPDVSPPSSPPPTPEIDFDSLKTLSNIGIDVSFLDNLQASNSAESAKKMAKEQLEENALLLKDLEMVQRERLSKRPEFTVTNAPTPTSQEIQLAGAVVDNLQELASKITPESLVAEVDLHGSMGISPLSSDEIDMDLLREFLEVPDS